MRAMCMICGFGVASEYEDEIMYEMEVHSESAHPEDDASENKRHWFAHLSIERRMNAALN